MYKGSKKVVVVVVIHRHDLIIYSRSKRDKLKESYAKISQAIVFTIN